MTTAEQPNAVVLALLENEMFHLKAAVADLKFQNARQNEKMEEIIKGQNAIMQSMAEARGGWKALLLMGGVAGSLGGLVTWLISNWRA